MRFRVRSRVDSETQLRKLGSIRFPGSTIRKLRFENSEHGFGNSDSETRIRKPGFGNYSIFGNSASETGPLDSETQLRKLDG